VILILGQLKMTKIDRMLVDASYKGDLLEAEYALENGADIHYQDDLALIRAVVKNDQVMVNYLLEHGANSLHIIANEQHLLTQSKIDLKILGLLLKYGPITNENLTQLLIKFLHFRPIPEFVNLLLKYGADANAGDEQASLLEYTFDKLEEYWGIFKDEQPDEDGSSKDIIDFCISQINKFTSIAEILIKYGAVVNSPSDLLVIAISLGDYELTKLLLEHGAFISRFSFKEAIINKDVEIVRLLLRYKPIITGYIFNMAVESGNKSIIKDLVLKGADPTSVDPSTLPKDIVKLIFNAYLSTVELNSKKAWDFWLTWAPYLGEDYAKVAARYTEKKRKPPFE
jgi:ankyrin repeat protein